MFVNKQIKEIDNRSLYNLTFNKKNTFGKTHRKFYILEVLFPLIFFNIRL